MAENQRLIRLARGYNGFFCPDTRFHLIGGLRPQANFPAGVPLSVAVKRGLKGGSLVDVYGTCQAELTGNAVPSEQAPVIPQGNVPNVPLTETFSDNDSFASDDDVKTGEDENPFKRMTYLTSIEIEDASKKDLQAFIEGNQLDLGDLGLNSRSKEADIKEALKKHFGH